MANELFIYDPYNQVQLPVCCGVDDCAYTYDPNTGEKYPIQCGGKVLGIDGDQQVYCLSICD